MLARKFSPQVRAQALDPLLRIGIAALLPRNQSVGYRAMTLADEVLNNVALTRAQRKELLIGLKDLVLVVLDTPEAPISDGVRRVVAMFLRGALRTPRESGRPLREIGSYTRVVGSIYISELRHEKRGAVRRAQGRIRKLLGEAPSKTSLSREKKKLENLHTPAIVDALVGTFR